MKKMIKSLAVLALLFTTVETPVFADYDTPETPIDVNESVIKTVYGQNSSGRIDYDCSYGTAIYASVTVSAEGTIVLNGSGNATSASLNVTTNKNAYVSISYYLTYSGSKVTVHYTLKPKQSTTIIRTGKTGTITLG